MRMNSTSWGLALPHVFENKNPLRSRKNRLWFLWVNRKTLIIKMRYSMALHMIEL